MNVPEATMTWERSRRQRFSKASLSLANRRSSPSRAQKSLAHLRSFPNAPVLLMRAITMAVPIQNASHTKVAMIGSG
jgi:hypothetical protein